jgi:hypothetical protein
VTSRKRFLCHGNVGSYYGVTATGINSCEKSSMSSKLKTSVRTLCNQLLFPRIFHIVVSVERIVWDASLWIYQRRCPLKRTWKLCVNVTEFHGVTLS